MGPHRGSDWSAPKAYGCCIRFGISVVGVAARRVWGGQPSGEVDEERAIPRKKVIAEVALVLETVDSIGRPTQAVLSRRGEVRRTRQ